LEDYDRTKEEIGDGLPKAFGQELETSVFFMPTMHMTTRLGAPLQESLFLLETPQSCGQQASRLHCNIDLHS
jgi:hypothetical protein